MSDQAVYKRLVSSGVQALQLVFATVSASLAQRLDTLEQWHLASFASAVIAVDETVSSKVKRILITELLADQSRDISLILTSIIEILERAVLTHKKQFKGEKLVDIFSPSLGYHMQKVFLYIPNRENAEFAAVNLRVVKQALVKFQSALAIGKSRALAGIDEARARCRDVMSLMAVTGHQDSPEKQYL